MPGFHSRAFFFVRRKIIEKAVCMRIAHVFWMNFAQEPVIVRRSAVTPRCELRQSRGK
jgi:hypothetical protein